jgi:hypothetical protein
MGQAKQRGSYQQRLDGALLRVKQARSERNSQIDKELDESRKTKKTAPMPLAITAALIWSMRR